MREPVFDIYSRTAQQETKWVAKELGFGKAVDRMKEIAGLKPGRYFVFCRVNKRILVELEMPAIDTKPLEPKFEWRI